MSPNTALAPTTLQQALTVGEIFVKSGFFKDSRAAAQAVTKILAGAEIGVAPVAAMTGIHIIDGKISLSANLMATVIKRTGRYNFRIREHTAQRCEIEFFEGGESIGRSAFSLDEATAAGLTNNPTWRKYPRNMLFARAMSNGAKWFCADAFAGSPPYTPDELGAETDHDGNVIDVEAIAVEPAPAINGAWPKVWERWERLIVEAREAGVDGAKLAPIAPEMSHDAIADRIIEVKDAIAEARAAA